MRYVSTRGRAPVLGFEATMLAGLAADGGLYVPETWPTLDQETIAGFAGRPYADVAFDVMTPFIGDDVPEDDLRTVLNAAYATFAHRAVAPLVQIGPNDWVMELFHGPTLAFKDVAMQVLARLMDRALTLRGRRATIVGATSGDTGGAAIEAFQGRDAIDIFILHPHGRTSDVQRRQMTTVDAPNVHNIALEGTFDDCQALVKALFNDAAARERLALSGVNSINWARIMAQVVYYFTTGVALGAPTRAASYSVPTGNFGDVLAGYVAKRMGLPIDRLIVATNVNDILARTLATGRYEVNGVVATTAPSMDIQVSSNFERLIFDAVGRDAGVVEQLMAGLKQSGAFDMPAGALAAITAEFDAGRSDEAEIAATMARVYRETGEVLDPHTAIGVHVAEALRRDPRVPMVTLGTAHPAKFPAAVEAAIGLTPMMPDRVGDLSAKTERYDVLANDYDIVRRHIENRSRAVTESA